MATAEILGCLLCVAVVLIKCAPAPAGVSHELDGDDGGDGDIIPYDAPDIDSQQLRGRYDARLLSENVSGYQYQSAGADEEATSCRNANAKYVHGQKVPRSDPCEICLCVDGEIFCWWKKCDHLLKKFAQLIKHRRKSALAQRKRKKTATAKTSSLSSSPQSDRLRDWQHQQQHNDKSDGIPSNVRNFPQHLAPHLHSTAGDSSVDDSAADMSDDVATIARHGRPEIEANIKSGRHPAPTSTSTFPASSSSSSSSSSLSSPIDGNHYRQLSNNAVAAMRSGPESGPASKLGAGRNTLSQEQNQHQQPPEYSVEGGHGDNSNEDHRTLSYFNQHADDSKVWRDIAVSGEIIIDDKIVQSSTPNNRSSGVSANDDDQQQQQSSDSVATSISAFSVLPPSMSSSTPIAEERGYYEKTIFNKNGVFIENIRKIGNLEADNGDDEEGGRNGKHVEGGSNGGVDDDDDNVHRKVILNAQTSVVVGADSSAVAAAAALSVDGIGGSGRGDKLIRSGGRDLVVSGGVAGAGAGSGGVGGGEVDEDADAEAADEAADEDEARERQKIALMSVPLSEHYVITSSGRIAKTADALASDDVISQFREGLAGAVGDGGGSDDQTPSTAADAQDDIGAAVGASIMQTQSAATSSANGVSGAGAGAGGRVGGGGAQLSSTVRVVKQMPSAVDHRTTKGPAQPMLSGGDAVSIQPMCIVMGKSYVVGTVLPQEAGNCLQCVCTSGTPEDVSPRVTCSSHNCPPLILPDLFDATGY